MSLYFPWDFFPRTFFPQCQCLQNLWGHKCYLCHLKSFYSHSRFWRIVLFRLNCWTDVHRLVNLLILAGPGGSVRVCLLSFPTWLFVPFPLWLFNGLQILLIFCFYCLSFKNSAGCCLYLCIVLLSQALFSLLFSLLLSWGRNVETSFYPLVETLCALNFLVYFLYISQSLTLYFHSHAA